MQTQIEQLMTGNINAYITLFHSFAFGVDEAGRPIKDAEWMSTAVEMLSVQSRQGNGFCMALFGTLYLYGWGGVGVDYSKALGLIKRTAGLGNHCGEFMLGFAYICGWGVARDEERALHWFKLSSEYENPLADNMLGYMAEEGLAGIKKNFTEALKYYRQAADKGLSFGMYNLARCYAKGIGVSYDNVAAFQWYQKAAGTGNAYAQYELAHCYEKGLGTSQNIAEAIKYYLLASRNYGLAQESIARLGREKQQELIDQIKTQLTI